MYKIKTVVMMGLPGSGKGTQANKLAEYFDGNMCSTGEVFRNWSDQNTTLGKKIKDIIDNGNLMPHWMATYVFQHYMFDLNDKEFIVFEGACRTLPEAQAFVETCNFLNRQFKVIYLNLKDKNIIIDRLKKRAIEQNRADDSNEKIIQNRFDNFLKNTKGALHYLDNLNCVEYIDGDKTPDEVFQEILNKLK